MIARLLIALLALAVSIPSAWSKPSTKHGIWATPFPAMVHEETYYCTFDSNPWTSFHDLSTGYHAYFTLKKFYDLDIEKQLRRHISPLAFEED